VGIPVRTTFKTSHGLAGHGFSRKRGLHGLAPAPTMIEHLGLLRQSPFTTAFFPVSAHPIRPTTVIILPGLQIRARFKTDGVA
jgi:hypothetical protein